MRATFSPCRAVGQRAWRTDTRAAIALTSRVLSSCLAPRRRAVGCCSEGSPYSLQRRRRARAACADRASVECGWPPREARCPGTIRAASRPTRRCRRCAAGRSGCIRASTAARPSPPSLAIGSSRSERIERDFPDFVLQKGGADASVPGSVASRLRVAHWVRLIRETHRRAKRRYSS